MDAVRNVPDWFAFTPLDTLQDAAMARLQALMYYSRWRTQVWRCHRMRAQARTTTRFSAVGPDLTCLRSSGRLDLGIVIMYSHAVPDLGPLSHHLTTGSLAMRHLKFAPTVVT
jgi:hypothetical protein